MIDTPKGFFNGGSGNAAMFNNGQLEANPAFLTNSGALRQKEQIEYDTRMVAVARKRLRLMNLLRSKGLVRNLGGLGTILSMYERSGDFDPASVDMSGRTRSDQDSLTFDEVGVPIPIFHKEFELDARRLDASRRLGTPLDSSSIEIATRIVTDEIESHGYNGLPNLQVSGNTVYGFANHPDRNTVNIGTSWATADGATIIDDVSEMLDALYSDNFFGPFTLCVPKNAWANLQADYSANKGDNTIMDRIKAFIDIEDVIPGDYLADDNVVMFNTDTETVDLAIAQDMSNIPWQTQPMQTEYKVFAALAIRVKSDKGGRCGVVHASL